MRLVALSKQHLNELFDFELENRTWFESLIQARANDFYCEQGVYKHIEAELARVSAGSAFCGLLVKDNKIVARANLRDIEHNKALVGYRVSKRFTSQGYASFCLTSLIQIAKAEFAVKFLEANVLENNPASKHVLQKQGFEIIGSVPNFMTLNNKTLACTKLRLKCV